MSDELRNKPVERGHLFGIAASFGFDPNRVTEMRITPDYVEVVYMSGSTLITASIPVLRP